MTTPIRSRMRWSLGRPNLHMTLVPAQGFEPWTIGLKDRRSNQAELRRLKMILPVFRSSDLHRRLGQSTETRKGPAWLGSPLPSLEPPPLADRTTPAKPEIEPASCLSRSWQK